MNPADLPRTVVGAVRRAVEDGELPVGVEAPGRVVVERTRPGGVGEYATPVAFQVAKSAGRRPAEVAAVLARRLEAVPGIERVDVTGAGFLNFVLAPLSPVCLAALVVAAEGAGDADTDTGTSAPAEPPPGHVGHVGQAGRDGHAGHVGQVGHAGHDGGGGHAGHAGPTAHAGPTGLRERVVRDAVGRILRAQGSADEAAPPHDTPVAPVAQRDGDVLARYGSDAARWAMLVVPARETPEFSDGLLVQGEASAFFRVRYAHARARALVANAALLGFGPAPGETADGGARGPLLRALADYPLVLEAAAYHRAPERLARHLVELADALLDYQYRVLPHGDEKPSAAHRARLALAEAAGTVLAGGLALLGIAAPTRL
ncbi:ArgS-related anticodon-binding protein NrtL [Streptomyces sp. NPDC055254]